MNFAVNRKPNIAFKGLQEDIKVSQEILSAFRKEVGRPGSNTFIKTRILQNSGKKKFDGILHSLDWIRSKFNNRVDDLRSVTACIRSLPLPEYIKGLREFIIKYKAANCVEMARVIQYEHLKRGIETHNVCLKIQDINTRNDWDYLRDHVFSLRNLPENADLSNPETWGEAILVDSWCGSGIVDQAVRPKGLVKKGALDTVLEYFSFNPAKEKFILYRTNIDNAEEFIKNMNNNGR